MNWRTSTTEIPRGNAGNRRTLAAMSMLARESSIDPVVVKAAQDAVRGTPERNPDADFAAILADVRRRMRYTHDPLDAEVVKSPRYVIDQTNLTRFPEPMDCDDASTLCGAMLGAIGYSTKFVTAAVDRTRPKEWSHVYLAVQHPEDGRWIPLDPIVREFEVGEQVPAGQLTAPLAYHEGVTAMRGLGCDVAPTGSGNGMTGLGYGSRWSMGDYTDETGTYAGTAPTVAQAEAAGGTQAWGSNPYGGGSSSGNTPSGGGGATTASILSQLLTGATSIFTSANQASAAQAQAEVAKANAAALAKRGLAVNPAGGGLFKNANGTLNTTNVVIAVGVVGLLGFVLMKAARGRR